MRYDGLRKFRKETRYPHRRSEGTSHRRNRGTQYLEEFMKWFGNRDPEEVRAELRQAGKDCPFDENCTVIVQPMQNSANGNLSLQMGLKLHRNNNHPELRDGDE